MTIDSTTRLRPAHIIRHIRKDFRIRFLRLFAIDSTMRARDDLSYFEQAAEHDRRIRALAESRRAHGMSHPRYLIK